MWLCVAAVGLITVVATVTNAFLPAGRSTTLGDLGHDFLAFYSAGRLVHSGQSDLLYSLSAMEAVQRSIARVEGIDNVAPPVAPWWNPPHAAVPFAPLSTLGFYNALAIFSAIGMVCLATSAWMLKRLLHGIDAPNRAKLLVPAALIAAPATLQALGHGQNTFLSLLLVTLIVAAWRGRLPIAAGLACALLCYKPQLAAIVSLALLGTLGWRVGVGLMLGLVPIALATVSLLPGTLMAFVARVPANLNRIQLELPYVWHRHVTFNGFWRFLVQGNAPAETSTVVTLLSFACVAAIGGGLALCWWRLRGLIDLRDEVALDRFIAAALLATPLMMPFFFDYDLLLLCVAGVLIGREMLVQPDASRAAKLLRIVGPIAFVWSMFNPAMAEIAGLNLTVPLLAILAGCQMRRCIAYAASITIERPMSEVDRLAEYSAALESAERLAA